MNAEDVKFNHDRCDGCGIVLHLDFIYDVETKDGLKAFCINCKPDEEA